jgi:hypothetical protein
VVPLRAYKRLIKLKRIKVSTLTLAKMRAAKNYRLLNSVNAKDPSIESAFPDEKTSENK